jgi:hypothetical protein
MAQVFRDVCRRDYRRSGLAGMAALWARTSLDLFRTTVEEHIERGIDMNREKFVRWSGWALMAGALLFALGLIIGSFDSQWEDPIGGVDAFYEIGQIAGIVLGQALFVIGLVGLRAGYASRSGTAGAVLLILAAVGAVASFGGMLFMSTNETGWAVWAVGLLTMTVTLALFGIIAIRRRVFSRWNFAPVLAGAVLPVLFGVSVVGGSEASAQWVNAVAVGAMAVGLILIGYRMQADIAGRIEPAV